MRAVALWSLAALLTIVSAGGARAERALPNAPPIAAPPAIAPPGIAPAPPPAVAPPLVAPPSVDPLMSAATWARLRQPAPGPARAIGGYSAGCIQGAVALPLVGAGF